MTNDVINQAGSEIRTMKNKIVEIEGALRDVHQSVKTITSSVETVNNTIVELRNTIESDRESAYKTTQRVGILESRVADLEGMAIVQSRRK